MYHPQVIRYWAFHHNVLCPVSYKEIICFSFLLFYALNSKAQADEVIHDIMEQNAERNGNDADYTSLLDQLNEYRQHPININKASKQQLEILPLTEFQISAFLEHRKMNGELIDLLELQAIDFFDLQTIRSILPFVKINTGNGFEDLTLQQIKKGKHELLIRYQQVIEKQDGYLNKTYLGSPAKIFAKYRYELPGKINLGMTMEKDQGEEFFKGTQSSGFDFYSAYLLIKNMGKMRSLIIGDYKIQYGQGLGVWSDMGSGKSTDIFSVKRRAQGVRPYTSANESGFFRGIASGFEFGHWQLNAFLSHKKIDGVSDSLGSIGFISQTGYHRTLSEITKKKQTGGIGIWWKCQLFQKKLQYWF
jgi:hypothetical protein